MITMRKLMVQNGKTLIPRSYRFQIRRSDRMQPTAQAVGGKRKMEPAPERRKIRIPSFGTVFPARIHRGVEHQSSKLTRFSNCPLHNLAFICYKQFTESICVAGWALFCNSRARPASNGLEGLNSSIAPATGLDSETPVGF